VSSQDKNTEGLEGDDLGIHHGLVKAAQEGDPEAQVLLGLDKFYGQNGVDHNEEEGISWMHSAAVKGNMQAQEFIASVLVRGHAQAPQDVPRGIEFAEKAATEGSVKSMELLGTAYYSGTGLDRMSEKDRMAKAFHWMKTGAKAGSYQSQTDLADMYRLGRGVKQSYKKALTWYNKVANQHQDLTLNRMPDKEKPSWKANATAVAKALNNIGAMHSNGWGCTKDIDLAITLMEKADKLGHPNAGKNAEILKNATKSKAEL